ncbi:MAG TPA: hypothetical protein VI953_01605 [Candidatus Paceibacterota bacterium]
MKEVSNKELIEKIKGGEHVKVSPRNYKFAFRYISLIGLIICALLIANYTHFDSSSQIISENSIHGHAHLLITIKGKHIIIPAGVGLTQQVEHPDILHTHLADNEIHMEMDPPIYDKQITVGEFFKVWGQRFTKRCIFDNCTSTSLSTGGGLHFLVNGRLNNDFDKYIMRDGDEIEILFE